MAKHVTHRHRRRMLGIQDAILRSNDAEWQERIVVIWNIGCDRDLHAVARISRRIDDRAIDALRARPRSTVEVSKDMILAHIEAHGDIDRRAVAINPHRVGIGTLRQCGNPFDRRVIAALEDEFAERLQIVELELFHHIHQAAMADLVAGRQRIDVTNDLMALAHIIVQDVDEVLVDLATLGKLHDRNEDALFINLVRIRPKTAATDIDHVCRAGEISDKRAVAEARRNDGEVVQVAGPFPRIVGDIDITFEDVLRPDIADEVTDGFRHGVDMAGRTGDRLGDHQAAAIEDAGGQVARFTYAGRESRADEGDGLLFDDGDQPVPHDLHVNVGKCIGFHG